MEQQQQNDETTERYCEFCGNPEPCSLRACMEALSAIVDYAEGQLRGDA